MQRNSGVRAIERAMVEIARDLGRRDLGRQVERRLGRQVDGAHLLVVDAIEEGSQNGEPPTVGRVARLLGVHPSRASRTVNSAIRAGLAQRIAAQGDGRKSCLELTAKGRELARAIHRARARYFAQRMKGWPRSDRLEFGRLLVLFGEKAVHDASGDGDGVQPEGAAAEAEKSPGAQSPAPRPVRGARRDRNS